MLPVSKQQPCPVCEGNHKCSTGDRGLILCGRRDGPVPGFRHLGPAKGDPQFHQYRREDGTEPPLRGSLRPPQPKPGKPPAGKDWPAIARRCAEQLRPDTRRELASRLSLPVEALDAIPLIGVDGRTKDGWTFTFPECDAAENVIGINRRAPDGSKKMMTGGRRGLTLPAGWRTRPGPLFIVEGASDVLALFLCGLAVIGRFSNTGGAELLAELLTNWPADRCIIFIGENDRKPDGKWPGRDGAIRTATDLAGRLRRQVSWAMIPDEVKDSRAWVVEWAAGSGESFDWPGIGRELVSRLEPVEVTASPTRPRIVIGTDEHRVNDEAATALGADPDLYQRAGLLVRVTCDPLPVSRSIRRPASPRIDPITPPTLRERMTRCADWRKRVEGEEESVEVDAHPPGWSVQAVHARREWPTVRPLEAVAEYPLFLADGRLLTAPGYDPSTGLVYHPPADLALRLPDSPTQADAVAAVGRLLDVVEDFPFAGEPDKAAWVAALLTPLARFSFSGPCPLFLVDGNCRGVGKGLLLDVVSHTITGQAFAVCPYTNEREELRKLITSIAVEGDRLVLFDNLDGRFGNDILDMALTGTGWKGRLLGTNTTARVPLWAVWYGTGNNVSVGADTVRRVCPIRLETPMEAPEQRGDFRRPDLLGWVADNRPRLLADALTILGAWHRAGRPNLSPKPWGSYAGWSSIVRNAVMWAGLPDPAETRVELLERSDIVAETLRGILIGLERLDPSRHGLTAGEIFDRVFTHPPDVPEEWFQGLRAALEESLSRREPRALGYKLRSFRRRVHSGRFLDTTGEDHGSARWVVRPEAEFRKRTARTHALDPGFVDVSSHE